MFENFRLSVGKIVFAIIALVVVIFVFSGFRDNDAGQYQIVQEFDGDLWVRNDPGVYFKWFATITTYNINEDIVISSSEEDQRDVNNPRPSEKVLFPNGNADIEFVGQYEVPRNDSIRIALHIKYGSNGGLQYMVSQQIIEVLKNSATLMSAEEAYSSKRAEYVRLSREQCMRGLYKAKTWVEIKESAGQKQEYAFYAPDADKAGQPIIVKSSILGQYNLNLTQFNIKGMTFDDKLNALIDSKREAQKATQEAETAKAKGEAKIAEERATQEVQKIKEVTIAQKEKEVAVLAAQQEYEVAKLQAMQAEQTAKATITNGRAEAEANRLKVSAGLTPQERAEWDYKTRVDVAKAWATWTAPDGWINVYGGGGSGNGGRTVDPFEAVGLKAFMDINGMTFKQAK